MTITKLKTFTVPTVTGPQEAIQHATFTHYLQGEQFRFVVTQLHGEGLTVTHRLSGRRVCEVTYTELAACRNSAKDAGKLALAKFIDRIGAARVRSVLAAAEGTK